MNRQGILACGYFGFGNLGDEAVLGGLIHGVHQAGYAESFWAMSADVARTQREHTVQAVRRTDVRAVWQVMRRSRVFVLGGGSLLQDITSARSIVYYLGMHALARQGGCRIAWIGQGIGPLRRGWARRWTARAARQAEVIVVREEASAELLVKMRVPNVQVGADLSFLLPAADPECGWRTLQQFGIVRDKPIVALAPRHWVPALLPLLRGLVRHLAEKWQAQTVLLPMHPHRDIELSREIAAGEPTATVIDSHLSVQQAKNVLSCCQMVIGVRLHALMLAAAAGVPCLAISYDPKVRAFWEQVEPKDVLDIQAIDAHTLQQRVDTLWERRESLCERVVLFAEQQRKLAWRNIETLMALSGAGV